MVLEDSCGAATASAEACDENPNCSAARMAGLPKSRATAHLCQFERLDTSIDRIAAAKSEEHKITVAAKMEWLQDQLLRLAARYYCQDMDIDASKLQIEKWDAESCRVRATDLRLTNEHLSLIHI